MAKKIIIFFKSWKMSTFISQQRNASQNYPEISSTLWVSAMKNTNTGGYPMLADCGQPYPLWVDGVRTSAASLGSVGALSKDGLRDGGTVPWESALAALPEDPRWAPALMLLHIIIGDSSSRRADNPFCPPGEPAHTRRCTRRYKQPKHSYA